MLNSSSDTHNTTTASTVPRRQCHHVSVAFTETFRHIRRKSSAYLTEFRAITISTFCLSNVIVAATVNETLCYPVVKKGCTRSFSNGPAAHPQRRTAPHVYRHQRHQRLRGDDGSLRMAAVSLPATVGGCAAGSRRMRCGSASGASWPIRARRFCICGERQPSPEEMDALELRDLGLKPPKPTEWACTHCTMLNFVRRERCARCGKPKNVSVRVGVASKLSCDRSDARWCLCVFSRCAHPFAWETRRLTMCTCLSVCV
jgi:hypothetical protein